MKHKLYLFVSTFILALSACSDRGEHIDTTQAQTAVQASANQTHDLDMFSRDLGILSGSELAWAIEQLDIPSYSTGFDDGFSQKQPAYSTAALGEALNAFENHVTEHRQPEPGKLSVLYNAEESTLQLSYALGYVRASQFSQLAPDMNKSVFLKTFTEAYEDPEPFDIEAASARIRQYVDQQQAQIVTEQKQLASSNLDKSNKFLTENKDREGIVTTPSGLQYQVLVEGDGEKPKAEDTVEVHYEGRLLDGTVFDSSYQRNQSATFPLNGVIRGWTEGLQYMPIGAKYRFFIPPNLGYGEQGSGNTIGPNELLIFDVELISIQ